MDEERLLKLADLVEDAPRENFNMAVWKYQSPACGTVCCAIGTGVEAGLFPEIVLKAMETGDCTTYQIIHDDLAEFDAVAKVLGITYEEAVYLFAVGSYTSIGFYRTIDEYVINASDITPKQVADKIRTFVYERRLKNAPDQKDRTRVLEGSTHSPVREAVT